MAGIENYEEIPIDPGEATDLGLHVRNCLKRHVALVRLISAGERRNERRDMRDWFCWVLALPAIGFIAWKLATLPPEVLHALGPAP